MTVYMRHIRAAGLCSRGARDWFSAHDLSWTDFLSSGISVERLRECKDALADRVIKAAEAEAEKESAR